jgi:cobalt/nickel transport system ATP-binding protein
LRAPAALKIIVAADAVVVFVIAVVAAVDVIFASIALATVLVMEPEILVMDEPSSNLDPASRRELADVVRSLDVTVLMVTHDLPYALELCPRSVILSGGRIVADGATRDILLDDALMAANRLELPYGFDPRGMDVRR